MKHRENPFYSAKQIYMLGYLDWAEAGSRISPILDLIWLAILAHSIYYFGEEPMATSYSLKGAIRVQVDEPRELNLTIVNFLL